MTKHVTGVDPSHGGSGDPSPFTALGVRRGIEACVKFKLGKRRRSRASTSRSRASATSATTCARSSTPRAPSSPSPTSTRSRASARSASSAPRSSTIDAIFEVECDVFAPCALGAGAQRRHDPAACARRSSRAPRTTSSPSRATATTSTRAASSTRPTTRSTRAASSTSPRRSRATTPKLAREGTLQDLRHDLRDLRAQQAARRADLQGRRHDGRGEARRGRPRLTIVAGRSVDRGTPRSPRTCGLIAGCGGTLRHSDPWTWSRGPCSRSSPSSIRRA